MKQTIKYLIILVVASVVSSCADFEELEENPNRPASVPASLVLRGVLSDLNEEPWSLAHRQNQFWACNYAYYGNNEYWTNVEFEYLTLKNVLKMEEEAAKSGNEATPYAALAKYLKAVLYTKMTQRVGDLPLDEALQGLTLDKPRYNTQKEVYVQVLTWLDEANEDLKVLISNNDLTLQGDIFYNGDLRKWQKAVNTFKLRVLIGLSKKTSETDLQIANRFAEVINNPGNFPVMTSNADNMNYVYNGTTQIYPTSPSNKGFDKGRYNMAQTYVKGLTDLNDPRVFVTCNPAAKKIKAIEDGGEGLSPADFAAFIGAPSGESQDDMTVKAGNGEYSYANQKRYYATLAGPEPGVQLAYWELCFNIAEAINRGWVTGNAGTYYENGIKASMSFYGITEGSVISITDQDSDLEVGTYTASINNYLAQPSVTYAGNNATGLNQILTQKYLAFFQNSGQEAYFNYRRTGVPAFHVGPGTGNSGIIPKRWLYPVSESLNNEANYKQALQQQFGGVDDVDNELWINQ